MTILNTIVAATSALVFVGAAHADSLRPIEARSIDLGAISGVAYYTVERDGFRVVVTLAQQGEGTTPVRTGIQTARPGYEAPVHSHPYLEILHILDGAAEAWIDGRESEAIVLEAGDTLAIPPDTPHAFRVRGDRVLRLLGTHASPRRIVTYKDGAGPEDQAVRFDNPDVRVTVEATALAVVVTLVIEAQPLPLGTASGQFAQDGVIAVRVSRAEQ